MDTRTYARIPELLSLRQAELAGRILITTHTDVRSISAQALDALYRRRWQVEVDLRSIKAEMGMDIVHAMYSLKVVPSHAEPFKLVTVHDLSATHGAHPTAEVLPPYPFFPAARKSPRHCALCKRLNR